MKIILSLLLLFCAFAVVSCDGIICSSSCSCSDAPVNSRYEIQSLSAINREYVLLNEISGRPTEITPLGISDTVNALHYMIELISEGTDIYASSNRTNILDVIFGKYAMACSLAPPRSYETINQIIISSNSDFSQLYPASSSLNEIFVVSYTEGDGLVRVNVNDFISSTPSGARLIQIALTSVPESSKAHVFRIQYMHEGGESFELFTEQVTFK